MHRKLNQSSIQMLGVSGALFLVGCSSVYKPPVTSVKLPKSQVIDKDAESCWKAVIRYFSDNNIPIDNLDHSSYFIKTKPTLLQQTTGGVAFSGNDVQLQNQWCDCGEASMANVWSTNAIIRVSYNIVLEQKSPTQTEVRINAFFDGQYVGKRRTNVPGYDVQMPIECVSKGTLEAAIWSYIQSH